MGSTEHSLATNNCAGPIYRLRYNENVPKEHEVYVRWWYEQFATTYQQLRTYLAEPYDRTKRLNQAESLWQQICQLCTEHPEPVKLTRLKAQLSRASKDKLFICLPKDIPCDNNRAERDLRPLVLKQLWQQNH